MVDHNCHICYENLSHIHKPCNICKFQVCQECYSKMINPLCALCRNSIKPMYLNKDPRYENISRLFLIEGIDYPYTNEPINNERIQRNETNQQISNSNYEDFVYNIDWN